MSLSLSAFAQDKWRLNRPTENTNESNNQSAYPQKDNAPNNNNNDNSNFRISLPPTGSPNSSPIKGNIEDDNRSGLTQVQLQKLADHDIILIIDKSGSMSTPDCPSSNHIGLKNVLPALLIGGSMESTRWQWCQQQTAQMLNLTKQVLPTGFTVLLFDSGCYLFPHVTGDSLVRIFANNSPGGSTNLTLPLSEVFNDYFKRQKLSKVKIKPLLIGIITDGCPDDPRSVKKMLVDLTHALHNNNEITIVFFLIGGHDSEGERFAHDLSQNLTKDGASFNIVKEVSFDQVQRTGLVQSLADNLD